MGVFYKPHPKPVDPMFEPIVLEALAMDKITDEAHRAHRAGQMLARVSQRRATLHPDPAWGRVIFAGALACLVFGLAIYLENVPAHAESSKTMLRAFEILFTAMLALLGIETVTKTG